MIIILPLSTITQEARKEAEIYLSKAALAHLLLLFGRLWLWLCLFGGLLSLGLASTSSSPAT